MKHVALSACFAYTLLVSCKPEGPQPTPEPTPPAPPKADQVDLGLAQRYSVEWLQTLKLTPKGSFESVTWTLTDPNGKAEELGNLPSYLFFARDKGSYRLAITARQNGKEARNEITLEVIDEKTPYKRNPVRVLSFRPAPGQFVNVLPEATASNSEEELRARAEAAFTGKTTTLISLGAFGGSLVFAFDHPVVNRAGKDFVIFGNARSLYNNPGANDAEPGCVWVAKDSNGNGIPDDDEWFELAGSEQNNPQTIHNYRVTYFRPTAEPATSADSARYIRWEDNQGQTGYIPKNKYHAQAYYPLWIKEDSYVLSGTRLPNNAIERNGIYTLPNFAFAYVDNYPNSSEDARLDIDWAVDAQGNKVTLDRIDFIKVVSGLQQVCGPIGETSTEVLGAADLHIPKR